MGQKLMPILQEDSITILDWCRKKSHDQVGGAMEMYFFLQMQADSITI
jgi:hypothetical protein